MVPLTFLKSCYHFLQMLLLDKLRAMEQLPGPKCEYSHWAKNQLFIQKLPRIWCLENVNFVKNETLKLWILRKMWFWNCEFCEKQDFEIVNFVKNEIFKLWFLWKMRFRKCEFCEKWYFQNVNFWINWGFLPQCDDDSSHLI